MTNHLGAVEKESNLMSLDSFRTLGNSGLHVSPLCLGAMTFGAPNSTGADEETSNSILNSYQGARGNFIDTSNVYCRGESERIIGRWLAGAPGLRERMILATKFSASATAGDPNSGGASRRAIIAACEGSLRRLQVDHIDLYWMHWQDPITPIGETMRALEQLVCDGKVRYIGFSDVPAWVYAHAQGIAVQMGWSPIIGMQIEYSLLERSVEFDYVEMAKTLGFGLTPWSPLGGGALTGKYQRDGSVIDGSARAKAVGKRLTDREYLIVDAVKTIAASSQCTPGQVALAWLCGREGVTAPIIGARTLAQFDENVGSLKIALSDEDICALDEVSKPRSHFPHNVLPRIWGTSHGGLTIGGRTFEASPAAPTGANSLG